jgi:enamine deaminase RidA (YjgF/YER057c/UK114 family)
MSEVTYLNPETAPPAQGLYSHAAHVSGESLIFIAGQLAVAADGSVAGKGDFAVQFKTIFDNLRMLVETFGAQPKDIVKFTTYLVHAQDIEAFMKLRAAYFPEWFGAPPYPPNTLLIVDRLVKEDFLLEVEAILSAKKP